MLFIFDMGGVVTNTFQFDSIYKKIGISKEDFFTLCKNKNELWQRLEKGYISVKQFWQEFNDEIQRLQKSGENPIYDKVQPIKNDLFRLFFHPSKNPQVVDLILSLKKNHRVVCGTNTIDSHWENHLERGDYGFFNQTYASNKIGEAKPDSNFFKIILEAENCSPKNAFFVDDKIENVMAAKSIGIYAVQFTTYQQLSKDVQLFLNQNNLTE